MEFDPVTLLRFSIYSIILSGFAIWFFFKWLRKARLMKKGTQGTGTVLSSQEVRRRKSVTYKILYTYQNRNFSFTSQCKYKPGALLSVYADPFNPDRVVVQEEVDNLKRVWILLGLIGAAGLLVIWFSIYHETGYLSENERTEAALSSQMNEMQLPYGSERADFTGSKYIAFFRESRNTPSVIAEVSDAPWTDLVGDPDEILWDPGVLRYKKEEGYDFSEDDNPVLQICLTGTDGETLLKEWTVQRYDVKQTEWKTGDLRISCLTDSHFYAFDSGSTHSDLRLFTCADLGDCRMTVEFIQDSRRDMTEKESADWRESSLQMVREIWEAAQIRRTDFQQVTAPGPWAKRKIEDINGLAVWARGTGLWKKNSLENLSAAEGSVQTLSVTPKGNMRRQFSGLLSQKYVTGDTEDMGEYAVDGRKVQVIRRYGRKILDEKKKKYRKAVDYAAWMEMGDEAVVCIATQYGTYEIEGILPLLRSIFSAEGMEIEQGDNESLELDGTEPVTIPDGFEDIGADTAGLSDPKYIVAVDESGIVRAAAEISTQGFWGGDISSVTWTESYLKESCKDISVYNIDDLYAEYRFGDEPEKEEDSTEKRLQTAAGELRYSWSVNKYSKENAELDLGIPAGDTDLWFTAEIDLGFDDEEACRVFGDEHLDAFVRSLPDRIRISTVSFDRITAAGPWAARLIAESPDDDTEPVSVLVPAGTGSWSQRSCSGICLRDGYDVSMELSRTYSWGDALASKVNSYNYGTAHYSVRVSEIFSLQAGGHTFDYVIVNGTGGTNTEGKKYCDCIARTVFNGCELVITIKTTGVSKMENAEEIIRELAEQIEIPAP